MTLTGLRCIEVHLGDGPVSVQFAGLVLAQLGAQVEIFRVVPSNPPALALGPQDERFERFLRGEKTVNRASSSIRDVVTAIAERGTELVLVGHEGGLNEVVRGLVKHLSVQAPSSHVVSISPFGLSGPKADWHGSNLVSLAAGGSAFYQPAGVTDRYRERPLQIGQYAGDLAAGITAVSAALASQFDATEEVDGRCSDVSVHESVLAMGLLNSSWVTHGGVSPSRMEAAGRRGASLGLLRCSDGLFSLLLIHESQWDRWVQVMNNPEWAASTLFATKESRSENKDALQHLIEEWASDYTKAEIWQAGQSANVPVFPVHTPREVLHDRQMVAREFFVPSEASAGVDRAVLPSSPLRTITAVPTDTRSPGQSMELRGLKVLDLSWVLAGPHATTWLGYMGADVIRVESSKRLDQFRANPPFRTPDRDPDQAGGFHHINQNKRSIAIDLTHEGARDLVLELAAQADVVVENFGAGMMERFGLSEAALRERRPDLIIASSSGLGRAGPDAGMRAYGQTIHAYAGLSGRVGYAPDDVRGIVGTWADPLTGVFQVGAILAALHHRRQTGHGANIDLSMAESAIFGTIPDVFVDAGAGEFETELAENRSRRHILNDVFRCQGLDEWVAISLRTPEQIQELRRVLGTPAGEGSPSRAEIEAASVAWNAGALCGALQEAGIASHPVNDAAAAISDAHAIERGMISIVPDADDPYPVATMPWRRLGSSTRAEWPLKPAPRLGANTEEILGDWLRMPRDEISRLRVAGVLR